MDNNRTSIIIIGFLAVAFLIAVYERLGKGLAPMAAGDSTGGSIVSLLIGGTFAAMLGAYLFNRNQDRQTMIRNMLVWGGIILAVVLVVSLFGIPGLTTTNTGVSI